MPNGRNLRIFKGKRANHNTFDIHMIKLLSTEDTLPVIAEKCKYA
jgi:hypothetical protein